MPLSMNNTAIRLLVGLHSTLLVGLLYFSHRLKFNGRCTTISRPHRMHSIRCRLLIHMRRGMSVGHEREPCKDGWGVVWGGVGWAQETVYQVGGHIPQKRGNSEETFPGPAQSIGNMQWIHNGATWQIWLNDLHAAAMRPYVKNCSDHLNYVVQHGAVQRLMNEWHRLTQ